MSWRAPGAWLRSVLSSPAAVPATPGRPVLSGVDLSRTAGAIDAIAAEQLLLAQGLADYLDEIREETRGRSGPGARARHNAAVAALKVIETATSRVAGVSDASRSRDFAMLAECTALLRSLSDSVCELTETIGRVEPTGPLGTLTGQMAEALHAVLLTASDTMAEPDEMSLAMLHDLTADRGQIMESIRRSLVRGEATLTIDEHQLLFTSTSLFERIVRLLRRFQTALAAQPRH